MLYFKSGQTENQVTKNSLIFHFLFVSIEDTFMYNNQ